MDKNQFGVYKFYLDGNKEIGRMVIGLLSDAEKFAREYLEGMKYADDMTNLDIFNFDDYVETIFKDVSKD